MQRRRGHIYFLHEHTVQSTNEHVASTCRGPTHMYIHTQQRRIKPPTQRTGTRPTPSRTCTAETTPGPNIICRRPMSHLAPSLTKTSSGLISPLYSFCEIFSRMSAFSRHAAVVSIGLGWVGVPFSFSLDCIGLGCVRSLNLLPTLQQWM